MRYAITIEEERETPYTPKQEEWVRGENLAVCRAVGHGGNTEREQEGENVREGWRFPGSQEWREEGGTCGEIGRGGGAWDRDRERMGKRSSGKQGARDP